MILSLQTCCVCVCVFFLFLFVFLKVSSDVYSQVIRAARTPGGASCDKSDICISNIVFSRATRLTFCEC